MVVRCLVCMVHEDWGWVSFYLGYHTQDPPSWLVFGRHDVFKCLELDVLYHIFVYK